MPEPHLSVKVWGDLALFSRPDLRVERVSYPVITPSAARGVLEAIFWKPEFRYRIRRIDVTKAGSTVSVLRNEIKDRQGTSPIVVEQARTQRTALMLRDVAYVVHADLRLRPHATKKLPAYIEQAERHVRRGSCFHRPYLGTRECAAHFAPPGEGDNPNENVNLDVGTMLFDLAFVPGKAKSGLSFRRQNGNGKRVVKGQARPLFFDAHVEHGVLDLEPHQHLYDQIDQLEGHAA